MAQPSMSIEYRSTLPEKWRQIHLNEIVYKYISGGTPSTKKAQYWDGDIAWTTSAPILENAVFLNNAQLFITLSGLENSASHVVPKDNLLIGTRVGVGKAVVNLIDIAISQDLTGLILNKNLALPEFLAYQFKMLQVQQFLDDRKRGTTIKGISRFDLQLVQVTLPPLAEQRAIAHTLRTAQAAVQTRQREATLERERKAALMQTLFSKGTRGKSRRETLYGQVPEHWREVKLENCAFVQTGIAKGRKLKGKQTIELPYLRVANVQDGHLDLSEIKDITLLASEVERYQLQYGDVVVTEGGDFDKLGRGFIWHNQIPGCVHQNHIFAIRPRKDVLLSEFLAYLIQSDYGKAYFLSVAHRTTNLASINSSKLKRLPVLIPEVSEQNTIVEILQKCDAKIAALEHEIALHEELFRALLEELMTGRTRVIEAADRHD